MRKKIVAGNWKMNKNFQEAEDLMFEIVDQITENGAGDTEIVICPPAVFLEMASDIAAENGFMIGAQNVSQHASGAYTGEISAPMLDSMGITHCIVGHSERRTYFGETDSVIAQKINLLIENGITPIYCCGEVLAERNEGIHFDVVKKQISEALFHLSADAISHVVIAYEPVWAIGTGVTASAAQAQEMHAYIRGILTANYTSVISDEISILYGGSCNAQNATELFANPDVDGGLIGGASLKAKDFVTIINSF
jgi:triosephosphate isomerase